MSVAEAVYPTQAHLFNEDDEVLVCEKGHMPSWPTATHMGRVFKVIWNTATGVYMYGVVTPAGLVFWRSEHNVLSPDFPGEAVTRES
jgi:hypothetical protein